MAVKVQQSRQVSTREGDAAPSSDPFNLPTNLQADVLQDLTTSHAIRHALSQLSTYSSQQVVHLDDLLSDSRAHTKTSRNLLKNLGQQIHLIEDEAKVLERRLKETGVTADRISESVRRLDEEGERVERAQQWAMMVADLKASLQSLAACIDQQDYTSATQHCIRAMSIDAEVLHSRFAASMVPTSDHPEPPPIQLEHLRTMLLQVFIIKFEAATDARDTVDATKYFKMFPLIGWKEEGLSVYRIFAQGMVRERGRAITEGLSGSQSSAGLLHASLLTRLFEHLAQLIDQHQPLVDKFYGAGNFAISVMPGLQDECDRLGKRICDAWFEVRDVQRKLDEAKSYAFTYVASIGKSGKQSTLRGPGGFSIPGRPSTPSVGGGGGGGGVDGQEGEVEVDTREVDRIIGEVAAMAARWGTYRLFLTTRLAPSSALADAGEGRNAARASTEVKDFRRISKMGKQQSITSPQTTSQDVEANEIQGEASDNLLLHSQLDGKFVEMMQEVYIPLESWFLRCSIEKAHRMDTVDFSARPLMSSLLDDIFYLVRMVMARAISTASLEVLSSTSRNVRYIIDEDFVQALVRKMDGVWKNSSTSMTVEGPRKDAASREMRSTFVVYLNVLATSAEYMTRIISELSVEPSLSQHFLPKEVSLAISTVQGLSILIPRIRNAVRTHLELLYTTLLKPKLRQLLTDSLRDVTYLVNEEEFSQREQENGAISLFMRRFIKGWENVLGTSNYRNLFILENWETMLRLSIETIVTGWEEWVMNAKYSELGALCFDKDVRSLTNFLSSQSNLGGLRDRFARLTHISYLVNLDDDADDADEEQALGGFGSAFGEPGTNKISSSTSTNGNDVAWRLSAQEVTKIRQRRVPW
ncbi:hypothetical protein CBS101457_003785 [Exobasidium rhododendri]|nr:hypothetical protein CBS101457_003785 [Exobasidium rhododendri]